MILGLSFAVFTALHVAVSLMAIAAGFVAIGAMLAGQWLGGWTALFLAGTALTAASGFLFPIQAIGPAHILGVLTLLVLVPAAYALYGRRLEGRWRAAYVVCATAALYFNSFVGLVQTFQKQPALLQLAPTGTELTFALAQGMMFVAFVAIGVTAVRRFRLAHPRV